MLYIAEFGIRLYSDSRWILSRGYSRSLVCACLLWVAMPLTAEPAMSGQELSGLGQTLWNYLTDGASITVGIGSRQTGVTVTRLNTEDTGKLVEQEGTWFLSYNTRASYFRESDFGYRWMFNLSSFEAYHQETAPEVIEDLGTHVDGYFAYVVPTIFYNFGDKYRGNWFRFGIGLGLGMTEFHGDIILTDSTRPNDRVTISNGPSNLFFAGGLFIEAQLSAFTFRIATAGPGLQYEGYKIDIGDTSVMLGYTHHLDWN